MITEGTRVKFSRPVGSKNCTIEGTVTGIDLKEDKEDPVLRITDCTSEDCTVDRSGVYKVLSSEIKTLAQLPKEAVDFLKNTLESLYKFQLVYPEEVKSAGYQIKKV